jgi:hypothetical protein
MFFVDAYNTTVRGGSGLAIAEVFGSSDPGWSVDFRNIVVTWTP